MALLSNTSRTRVSGTQQYTGPASYSYSNWGGVQSNINTYTGPQGFTMLSSWGASYPNDVPAGTGARVNMSGGNVDPYGDIAYGTGVGGMLANSFISNTRQAMSMPIQHVGNPLTWDSGNISGRVSIDWALGEKQATPGTPEFFRSLYRGYSSGMGAPYTSGGVIDGTRGIDPLSTNHIMVAQGRRYVGDGSGASQSSTYRVNASTPVFSQGGFFTRTSSNPILRQNAANRAAHSAHRSSGPITHNLSSSFNQRTANASWYFGSIATRR